MSISSDTPCVLPYLTEEVTYTPHCVVKCNGGVARTHACNQINCVF